MTAERDSMTLNAVSVPALGVEERSDEAPRAGRARPTPDPEVVAKPKRRQFTAEYRLRILEGGGSLHTARRGGPPASPRGVLYSSHLTAWRKARCKGSLRELAAKKRGAKPAERNRWMRRCARSRRKWLAWSTSCTPHTRSWTYWEKMPGCWD